jgi:hypothetical protein
MKLFSAFAAAELLEKDRQTVTRALRSTRPDGEERGQPRWKMSTIVGAMERHNRANGGAGSSTNDPELVAIYRAFETQFGAMAALPTLAQRRAAARKLAPAIAAMDRAVRQHGVGDDLADVRADQCMGRFEAPCEWTGTQCWENLDCTADVE